MSKHGHTYNNNSAANNSAANAAELSLYVWPFYTSYFILLYFMFFFVFLQEWLCVNIGSIVTNITAQTTAIKISSLDSTDSIIPVSSFVYSNKQF